MPESNTYGDPVPLRPLAVVSNREPYIHSLGMGGAVTWSPTTGGVSVALDALMRERGGVWIAHGAGDADRRAVDEYDRVWVPPDAPSYQLRRIWLTESEERHYYEGFANEGLWPLCHVAHVKPVFRAEDWRVYQDVNRRFAQTVDRELSAVHPDNHLSLSQFSPIAIYCRSTSCSTASKSNPYSAFPNPQTDVA